MSQGESAVTEPQVSAADQAPAEQVLEEAVPAQADATDEFPDAGDDGSGLASDEVLASPG